MPPKKKTFKKPAYKKPMLSQSEYEAQQISRIKLPHEPEIFGIVEQRVGGSRMKVRCLDGKERICRIPGRLKKRLWVREGDVIIVQPWEFGGDKKGDVLFKYNKTQVQYIKKKGYLAELEEFEEF